MDEPIYFGLLNDPEKWEERQAYFDQVMHYIYNKCNHRMKWIRLNVSNPLTPIPNTLSKLNFVESVCFLLGANTITIKNVNTAIDEFIALCGQRRYR